MANTFCRTGDQHVAKRRFGETIFYGKTCAVVFIFPRRHAFNFYKKIVQPGAPGKTGFKSYVSQAAVLVPLDPFGIGDADILQKFFWADTCPGGE